MIINLINDLGLWSWFVIGLALLIMEVVLPGFFFIWFGLAALLTGVLSFFLTGTIDFGWQAQVVLFLVAAVGLALMGRRFFGSSGRQDEPLLNQRGEQLVGQRATLNEPIINGRGRLRFNDTLWRVRGPDLPAGTDIRIISFDPITLELEVAP